MKQESQSSIILKITLRMPYDTHPLAHTTAQFRQEIKTLLSNNTTLAHKCLVHRHAVTKWRKHKTFEDKSHRPDHLQTTLSTAQEPIVLKLRKVLYYRNMIYLSSPESLFVRQRAVQRYCVCSYVMVSQVLLS